MRIASVSENLNIEKRISITPEIAKKYIALGLEVSLSENYANHLGIKDNEYVEFGVKISKDEKDIIPKITQLMEESHQRYKSFKTPIKVDFGGGLNWGEAH